MSEKHKTWVIHAVGKRFNMIDPKGCSEQEALAEAKSRWPDAKVEKYIRHQANR